LGNIGPSGQHWATLKNFTKVAMRSNPLTRRNISQNQSHQESTWGRDRVVHLVLKVAPQARDFFKLIILFFEKKLFK
jgi:hypothetical protein